MKKNLLLVFISGLMLLVAESVFAQTCAAPADNQNASYSGNRWYAFFYRNVDFTGYHGRLIYGNGTYGNFDENFQGSNVNYHPSGGGVNNTFNCDLPTETFSVRLRMTRNFTATQTYDIIVGSDDGVRLWIDGKLVIDEWNEHSYAEYVMPVYLTAGNHNLVMEYYENTGDNRLKFEIDNTPTCHRAPVTENYGSGTTWNAYYYAGKNFVTYRASGTAGGGTTPQINMNFGGDNVTMSNANVTGYTGCGLVTEKFSVRYKLTRNFPAGGYVFTVGGDDGYRLSLDGGTTWLIDNWNDHGFMTGAASVNLPGGNVNMVLEYYENGGGNSVFFDYGVSLPVHILSFDGRNNNGNSTLNWRTSPNSTEDRFIVEKSTDGRQYNNIGTVPASSAVTAPDGNRNYYFNDPHPTAGNAFYRLKIIDRDGPEKYSAIVNINTKVQAIAKIYPTLIDQNKQLFIQTDKNAADLEVVIRNISGQQVFMKKLGEMARGQIATLQLQTASLSKGTYVVQVLAGSAVMHKQMIIVP